MHLDKILSDSKIMSPAIIDPILKLAPESSLSLKLKLETPKHVRFGSLLLQEVFSSRYLQILYRPNFISVNDLKMLHCSFL